MNHREVMQQALEALELAKLNGKAGMYPAEIEEIAAAITALRAALAEPQDEPVAKVELMTTGGNAGLATRIVEIDDHLRERLRPGQMLYTHPATQRQPLSGHEIRRIVDETVKLATPHEHVVFHEVARAIERAHGIGGQDEVQS